MKLWTLLLCILLCACGGSLTDEQRKKAKADIERNQIRKISDAQITDAAFSYGRAIATLISKKEGESNSKFLDSVAQVFHVNISLVRANDIHINEKEKLILDAYASITNQADFTDNVQKLESDSILYTKPVLKQNSDIASFDYAIGVRMPNKEVILRVKN